MTWLPPFARIAKMCEEHDGRTGGCWPDPLRPDAWVVAPIPLNIAYKALNHAWRWCVNPFKAYDRILASTAAAGDTLRSSCRTTRTSRS